MYCFNCGGKHEGAAAFCPWCGAHLPSDPERALQNPAAEQVLEALKDPVFKILCILISVVCGISFLGSGMPLLYILATIFLWIIYGKSTKGMVHLKSMRSLSGVVFAGYVVNYVLYGLILLLGLLFFFILSMIGSDPALMGEMMEIYEKMGPEYAEMMGQVFSVSGWVVLLVCGLISAGGLLITIFGMRKIWRFVQSLYRGVGACSPTYQYANAAKNWLFVLGIIAAVPAAIYLMIGALASGLVQGSMAAVQIVSGIWIGNHFTEK